MSTPQRSSSTDTTSESSLRKRVCKACDRCRLKKSKCDGASPCSRCKVDNAICVFGERKKAHDKVYPKGYVEMLEQQQTQLVAGLRELYRRLEAGESWPGQPLESASNGHPLTHDILERLDLLHSEHGEHFGAFEEDPAAMQQRLVENGASLVRRRGSMSSDSEREHVSTPASYDSPPPHQQASFSKSLGLTTPPTSRSVDQSPLPSQAQFAMPVKQPQYFAPSMMQASLNPHLLQTSWQAQPDLMDESMDFLNQYDSPMGYDSSMQYPHYAIQPPSMANMDWNDGIDMDFKDFLQTTSAT